MDDCACDGFTWTNHSENPPLPLLHSQTSVHTSHPHATHNPFLPPLQKSGFAFLYWLDLIVLMDNAVRNQTCRLSTRKTHKQTLAVKCIANPHTRRERTGVRKFDKCISQFVQKFLAYNCVGSRRRTRGDGLEARRTRALAEEHAVAHCHPTATGQRELRRRRGVWIPWMCGRPTGHGPQHALDCKHAA